MRKLFLFIVTGLLFLLALVALVPQLNANSTTLTLTAPASSPPGSVVDIALHVSGAVDLTAYEFELNIDTTYVTYVDFVSAEFIGQTITCDATTERCALVLGPAGDANRRELGEYSYGNGTAASGTGLLGTIRLQSTGTLGATPVTLNAARISDANANGAQPQAQNTTLLFASPTAITLVDFSAEIQPDGTIRLLWQTATELDNVGFNVYRSATDTFDASSAVQLNAALIPTQAVFGMAHLTNCSTQPLQPAPGITSSKISTLTARARSTARLWSTAPHRLRPPSPVLIVMGCRCGWCSCCWR